MGEFGRRGKPGPPGLPGENGGYCKCPDRNEGPFFKKISEEA